MAEEVKCDWHTYIERYLEPMRSLCRAEMPENPDLCADKVSRPFYYWAKECERRGRLPPIPG